jgi:hypothetical protein
MATPGTPCALTERAVTVAMRVEDAGATVEMLYRGS